MREAQIAPVCVISLWYPSRILFRKYGVAFDAGVVIQVVGMCFLSLL